MLQNLIKNVAKNVETVAEAPQAKRRRFEQSVTDPLTAIENFCEQVYAKCQTLSHEVKDKIEIEARLGLITCGDARATPRIPGKGTSVLSAQDMQSEGYRFVAGVDVSSFSHIQPQLSKRFQLARAPESEVETVYNLSGGVRVRWKKTTNSRTQELGLSETKTRMYECNFLLPSAPFDLRITVSIEQPGEMVQAVPIDWQTKRLKRRTSCVFAHQAWRVDLTDIEAEGVGSGMGGSGKDQGTEVEFELQKIPMASWLGAGTEGNSEVNSAKESKRLAGQLWELLKLVNPLAEREGLTELEREDDSQACATARERLISLRVNATGRQRRDDQNFPGAMPVNLCRRHIPAVQNADYFVTEKTDGVRYLLVATEKVAVLVDRKMACFRIPGGRELSAPLSVGTVLDGELTFNRSQQRQVFIAFDLLTYGTDSYMNNNFEERLQVLKAAFKEYDDAVKGGQISSGCTPLVQKRFYHRREIDRLMAFFKIEEGERVFRESEHRHHRSDGIIFQPNTPYEVGTHKELLKWKWLDTVTIDFQARRLTTRRDQDLELACAGPDGTMIDVTSLVALAPQDKFRLFADMQEQQGVTIAEIAFDTETGLWTYKMLRPDKNSANFISTVMSTLVELAEGIGAEELQYRMCTSHSTKDDWSSQLKKMQRKAVEFRMHNKV